MPDTIPLRPRPIDVRVVHFDVGKMTISTLFREWSPGDTSRCGRCPSCIARGDRCMISVGTDIPAADAGDYEVPPGAVIVPR